MKVLSLFDGISCGMVALKRAGIPVDSYTAYEIDEDAIAVSESRWPEIHLPDVLFQAIYSKNQYDLLIGGSPCTYWSIAKAGGERETVASGLGWDLFSQYVRALKEVEPKYFLYENNASMDEAIKNCITEELGVDPVFINSADFSAQNRERLYWSNIPFSRKWKKSRVIFSDIIDTETPYKYRDFSKYADTVKISQNGLNCSWDTSGKNHYGQCNRARKINQKWNTVVSSGNDKNDIWVEPLKSRHITMIEAERLQTLPDNYTAILKTDDRRIKGIGNGWTVDVIAHILRGIKEPSTEKIYNQGMLF